MPCDTRTVYRTVYAPWEHLVLAARPGSGRRGGACERPRRAGRCLGEAVECRKDKGGRTVSSHDFKPQSQVAGPKSQNHGLLSLQTSNCTLKTQISKGLEENLKHMFFKDDRSVTRVLSLCCLVFCYTMVYNSCNLATFAMTRLTMTPFVLPGSRASTLWAGSSEKLTRMAHHTEIAATPPAATGDRRTSRS